LALPVRDAGLVDPDLFRNLPLQQLQHEPSAKKMVPDGIRFLRRLLSAIQAVEPAATRAASVHPAG
jgi:hypothetical protein